mgnify:CR=1 FL=1
MRRRATLCLVAGLIGLTAASLRGAARGPVPSGRAAIPAAFWDGDPSIWIFVRSGCLHCDRHLESLDRCLAQLDPAARRDALRCVRLVGGRTGALPGAVLLPAPWRDSLGVRSSPTTWLVDRQGHIGARWRGPRTARDWQRAISRLTAGGEP